MYVCTSYQGMCPIDHYLLCPKASEQRKLHGLFSLLISAHFLPHACACAARGKVIEFVIHSFGRQKNFEMAWTRPFQDFWAYQKLWTLSYLTCMYLLLGWFASTHRDFSCFLITRSILAAILFMVVSHAHNLYVTCSLTFTPMPSNHNFAYII